VFRLNNGVGNVFRCQQCIIIDLALVLIADSPRLALRILTDYLPTLYHCALMSAAKLSQYIDLVCLARAKASLVGCVPLAHLARLKDLLASEEGQVELRVEFESDLQHRMTAKGSLATDVTVVCQRCLQPMPLMLASTFCLCVVLDEEQAEQLPDTYEPWIVPEQKRADLYAMVEEELLLSLPSIVTHPEQDCGRC
jgi:uncharacterized protein